MAEYLARHPGYLAEVRRIDQQLLTWGFEPMSMEGVRQPFDYAPRKPVRSHG
jgi:hypothetical protein